MKNTELPEGELVWFRHFIDSRFWKFAKSYANTAPHAYTVREWKPDNEAEFEEAVEIIRAYGQPENYYRKQFIYLYLDGLKYWTMGAPIKETILINRCDWGNFYGGGK